MKRRSFINRSVIGAAGAAIASASFASILASCTKTDKKITLALIGCSEKGVGLIMGACSEIQNVSMKYVFDFDVEKGIQASRAVQKSLGYLPLQAPDMDTVYNDKEIDAVFIFLPEHWRALATIQACQAGKDAYVESIPSHSVREGQQMMAATKKYKRVIQCGYVLRNTPGVISAKEYIVGGNLGQVVHVKVYGLKDLITREIQAGTNVPEGVDWDGWLGPAPYHPYNPGIYNREVPDGWHAYWDFGAGRMSGAGNGLDLARMVVGDPGHPSSVYGCGYYPARTPEKELQDRQVITYDFEEFSMDCETGNSYGYMKNTPVSFEGETIPFQWLLRPNRVEIYGSHGLMYLDAGSGGWQVQGNSGKILAGKKPESSREQIRHVRDFIDCIRNREQPAGNIVQGHLSATLAHLGNIACRAGNKQLLFDTNKEEFTNNERANTMLKTTCREGYQLPGKL